MSAREPFVCLPKTLRETLRGEPRALALVFALACYANAEDVAWPSLATLARDVGCHVSTVARKLALLEQLGLIERERSKGGARSTSTRYRLTSRTRATGSSRMSASRAVAPVRHELEVKNEKSARARVNGATRSSRSSIEVTLSTSDRARAALRALELGERDPVASWVVNVGSHYVHDAQLFGDELRDTWKIDDANIVPALFERAKLIALERDAA